MDTNYDVIVVGAGPAGIFTCYELTLKMPNAKVILIDKGHDIYRRNCPILQKKIEKCPAPAGKKNLQAVCRPVRLQMALGAQEPIQMENLILQANLEAG